MPVFGGLQKSSLIDYPEKISAIIFTQGCNFRCPYCHNPELIEGKGEPTYTSDFLLNFLQTRQGKLDGVVITGGEPTLHKDLPDFIKQVKELGFYVKLDTNGTNPEMLKQLIGEDLIDYVAMDIKAPIEKYEDIVCAQIDKNNVQKSIEILKTSKIDYEFRTTVVKSQLTRDGFIEIGELIKGCDKYYLQKFVPTKTLNRFFINQTTYSDDEFEEILADLKKFVKNPVVR
jgi:pyruvate formate lyase activating enzyme